MIKTCLVLMFCALLVGGCAGAAPELSYPAFVQTDELEDVFIAGLPGARAKQLAGDPMTRRTSNRIDLPTDWQGTSGGAPGRSMEIFVLDGTLTLGGMELRAGGYAYLPAGSLGFNMRADRGARILYFVNDADPEAVIRSPILLNSGLLDWQPTTTAGITTKDLRKDPGSGAMTWLLRVEAGTEMPWQSSSVVREGYLLRGSLSHSECIAGEVITDTYVTGGYFYRPPGAVNGGLSALAQTESVWLLRETSAGIHRPETGCTQ